MRGGKVACERRGTAACRYRGTVACGRGGRWARRQLELAGSMVVADGRGRVDEDSSKGRRQSAGARRADGHNRPA
jgi:hypothetical protein